MGGGVAAAALFALAGCATDDNSPPPTPTPQTARTVPPSPKHAVGSDVKYQKGAYLGEMYDLSPDEAGRRHDNEALAGELNRSLFENPPRGFSALWIRHEPSYAVVVNVKPPYDRNAFIARAPEALRSDIRFMEVRYTRAEISRIEDRIIAALRNSRFAWSGGYEVQRDVFRYTAAAPDQVARLRAALPADLRDEVIIETGSQPIPLAR